MAADAVARGVARDLAAFGEDEFAALFIAKFCFCRAILMRSQLVPATRDYLPTSVPELSPLLSPPSELLDVFLAAMKLSACFRAESE
jgi:hypothetical protein